MGRSSTEPAGSLASAFAAPQHGARTDRPRPLPLFLALLREQTRESPERARRALDGLAHYQAAERPPPAPLMPAIAEADGAVLRDYGGAGAPVVFVPSLINPPSVLDISPERSLLRWLVGEGHRVLLVDWGWPDRERGRLSVGGHVEHLLVPLLGKLGEPPALVGYCLGGTMAVAAAAMAEVNARALVTLAAPWRFAAFADEARDRLARLWADSRGTAESLGLLPMEVLQCAFWSLDPARTVAKFEAFAELEGAQAATFVTLEDWANDGPPLALEAARELFEDLFGDDRTGRGEWRVGGRMVDPAQLGIPLLDIVSTTDRIVPAASAHGAGETLALDQGHVGMVVGSKARTAMWEPLAGWLSRHSGG